MRESNLWSLAVRVAVAGAVLCVLSIDSIASGQGLPRNLDAFLETVRNEWNVVGLSIAVVKDDRIVYAKGVGETKLGSGEKVDEDTLFAIGSNTKAFTAAGLGILVDEKRLFWDHRVTDHLPWFRLHEPYVTREITVRDILSHRSGLGRRGDLNWYATDFSREEIVRRIRYLEPNSSFRSEAGYQNTMFLTAGEVTEAITGVTWDEWIKTRILRPLGMTRTRTSVLELDGMENVAAPHERIDDAVVAVPHRNIDNVAPAGSILSSAGEMTRWLRMLLSEGSFDGKQILSKEIVSELWKPNIIYPLPDYYAKLFPSTHFSTYGLGFGLRDYRGRFVATHTGGIDGMLSQVLVLPEEDLGIVVLTNTSPTGSFAHNAITMHVLDNYLGAGNRVDWLESFRELAELQSKELLEARMKRDAQRVAGTSTSLDLEAYCGTFDDQMYGEVNVALEESRLVLRRHTKWVADLEHWHYDTFLARWRDPVMGTTLLTFRLSTEAQVDAIVVDELATFVRTE